MKRKYMFWYFPRDSLLRGWCPLLLWVSLLATSPAHAMCSGGNENTAVPSNTPTTRFTDNLDGTVTDKKTGLVWKRCSEGQAWDGTTCTGAPAAYTWAQALALNGQNFAGHSDWRVPDVKELRSIIELRCWNPSINVDIFPAMPADSFWSSSPSYNSGYAWRVSFSDGYSSGYGAYNHKSDGHRVRLVRAGE